MRALFWILTIVMISACQPTEQETHQVSTNMNLEAVPGFLQTVDALVDNDLDVTGLSEFSTSIPVDEEKQQKLAIVYRGDETTILYHVWRENIDTVHLYFSTPSEDLAAAIEAGMGQNSAKQ